MTAVGKSELKRTAVSGARGRRPWEAGFGSIQLKSILVVQLQGRVLYGLGEDVIADDECLDFCTHKAAEGIVGVQTSY